MLWKLVGNKMVGSISFVPNFFLRLAEQLLSYPSKYRAALILHQFECHLEVLQKQPMRKFLGSPSTQ